MEGKRKDGQRKFDLTQEELEGQDLLEQERVRQRIIADADSEDSGNPEQLSSNQGSNRLREDSYALTRGIHPIKEEESNKDLSQVNLGEPHGSSQAAFD